MSSYNSADQKTDVRSGPWWSKMWRPPGVLFVLFLIFCIYFFAVRLSGHKAPDTAAEFGEMFGGLSALLGGFALIAAYSAYQLQHTEHLRQLAATEDQKRQNARQITIAAYTAKLQHLTHLHKYNNDRFHDPLVNPGIKFTHLEWAQDNLKKLTEVADDLDEILEQTTNGKAKGEQAKMRLNHGLTAHYTTPKGAKGQGRPACDVINN